MPKEDCPHCLSLGGTRAQCGLIGSRNYDNPLNVQGNPLPPSVQATYSKGEEIEVEVILTAHHKGHFEFAACPIDAYETPSADCFETLEFVEDLLYGAPKDVNFPERAYLPPKEYALTDSTGMYGTRYSYRLKLPPNVHGDLVLLQWYYLTANSCGHPGYETYNFPAEWGPVSRLAECDAIPEDGAGVPEQFWNCAEVKILNTASSPPPTASPNVPGSSPPPSMPSPTATEDSLPTGPSSPGVAGATGATTETTSTATDSHAFGALLVFTLTIICTWTVSMY